jgi:hypothetical protein
MRFQLVEVLDGKTDKVGAENDSSKEDNKLAPNENQQVNNETDKKLELDIIDIKKNTKAKFIET